ncbi:hypothetical protein QE417_002984 [Mucilaginibacter terrae]|uniref:Uncharacterized protein n=1 Tax=Mucilaginibacter terrae TaxID=1955052 RepID=A0ABU3GY34_9SPHI|nr:hypothetical protein [Mucilaginibacter terrae]
MRLQQPLFNQYRIKINLKIICFQDLHISKLYIVLYLTIDTSVHFNKQITIRTLNNC